MCKVYKLLRDHLIMAALGLVAGWLALQFVLRLIELSRPVQVILV